jgi:hypothetical protein
MVLALTLVVAALSGTATALCAIMPHYAAIVRERSMARVRSAVIDGQLKAEEALLLLGEGVPATSRAPISPGGHPDRAPMKRHARIFRVGF